MASFARPGAELEDVAFAFQSIEIRTRPPTVWCATTGSRRCDTLTA
jgi:hypothetical protein